LQGVNGVPEIVIGVVGGEDDLELAGTAIGAYEVSARLRWTSSGSPALRSAASSSRFEMR
jgi:hypothetical protein